MKKYLGLCLGFSGIGFAFLISFAFARDIASSSPQPLILGLTQSAIDRMSPQELSALKVSTISALPLKGTRYTDAGSGLEVEIADLAPISANGQNGVQVFVRAWKNGHRLGFGKDATIETERVRIWNPPILVDDPNGNIVRTSTDTITGQQKERRLREDPMEAIRQDLAHTIHIIGKENATIIAGTVGHTTDIFRPDADPETSTVDGISMRNNSGTEPWATIIAGAGTYADPTGGVNTTMGFAASETSGGWTWHCRSFYLFNTATIGTDIINSATLSIVGQGRSDSGTAVTPNVDIYTATPASNTNLVATDYGQVGSTSQTGSPVAYASLTSDSSTFVDFTFNATGIGNINKSGISKFAARNANYDVAATAPTWSSGSEHYWNTLAADTVGSSSDPKLVVVHVAANNAPTTPTDLLTDGQTNPTGVMDAYPKFSAVYRDPDESDYAVYYRLQVSTSSTNWSAPAWDSGKTAMAMTAVDTRSPDITYGNAPLTLDGGTYYWRIKFWDDEGYEGDFSTSTASFAVGEVDPTATYYWRIKFWDAEGNEGSYSTSMASFTMQPVIEVSGDIDTDTIWHANYLYVINGTLTVSARLDIEAGVIVKFKTNASGLTVANGGVLNAQGASLSMITFTSYNDDIGGDTNATSTSATSSDWDVIKLNSGASSTLVWTNIRYGGKNSTGCIFNSSGTLTLSDAEISHCGTLGVYHSTGTTAIDGSNIHDNSYGITASYGSLDLTGSTLASNTLEAATLDLSYLTFTHSGNTATGNGVNGFVVSNRGSADWTPDGPPYVVNSTIGITSGALTIQAGTVVKFRQTSSWINVGSNGILRVQGTSESPVYFTSFKDDDIGGDTDNTATSAQAGDWDRIQVSSSGSSTIEWAIVRYGGNTSNGCVYNNGGTFTTSHPDIHHCGLIGVNHYMGSTAIADADIHDNTSYGIYASYGGFDLTGSNLTDNGGQAAFLDLGYLTFTHSNNTATGNGTNGFVVSGIGSDQTWNADGPAYVVSSIGIGSGKTLTIKAGAVVKFNTAGAGLAVSNNGILRVEGMSESPAYFTSLHDDTFGGDTDATSVTPVAGDWDAIRTNSGSSTIAYAVVRYGGNTSNGCVYNYGGTLTLIHGDISYCSTIGFNHYGGTTKITASNIEHNTYGLYASYGALDLADTTFSNNTTDMQIDGSVTFTQTGVSHVEEGETTSDTTWNNDYIHVVSGTFTVTSGTTLTINPGTIVKFKTATSSISVRGNLNAIGAPTSTIYFTSYHDDQGGNTDGVSTAPDEGDWDTIQIDSGGSATITNAIVRYGGAGNSTADIYNNGGTITLESVDVATSTIHGLYLAQGAANVTSSTFHDNHYGIYALSGRLFLTDNIFYDNFPANTYIDLPVIGGYIMGGTLSSDATWSAGALSYIIPGSGLIIDSDATLTINPGAIVKLAATSSKITVSGQLRAVGTSENPIYFTSYKDDSVGGDTDNASTYPDAGDWDTIKINSNASSTIAYAIILYGGNEGVIYNDGGTSVFEEVEIATSTHAGIYQASGTSTVFASDIHDNTYGIWVAGGTAGVSETSFYGNTTYGVYNGTAATLDALDNFWGCDAGPNSTSTKCGTIPDKTTTSSVDTSSWHHVWPVPKRHFSSVHDYELHWYENTSYTREIQAGVNIWNSMDNNEINFIKDTTTTAKTVVVADADDSFMVGNPSKYKTADAPPQTPTDMIYLNTAYFSSPDHTLANRENCCAHELGHSLGLGHANDLSTNIMQTPSTQQITLGSGDIADYHFWWTTLKWLIKLLNI
jgi:hypothetical protein